MLHDRRCTIRIHVPEEFMGFCIRELTTAGGTVESLASPSPGKQTIAGEIPADAYGSLIGKIRNYVGSDAVSFERNEARMPGGQL